jgi:DNA uptake protein ComE-like DNA-binding protein
MLLLVCLVLIMVPIGYKYWLLQQPLPPLALPALSAPDSGYAVQAHPQADSNQPVSIHLRPVDPNSATEADWVSLGAPPWLARRILKYRAKGGHFDNAEDVGRIYDFPQELLAQLTPYFIFHPKKNKYADDRDETNVTPQETAAPISYPILDLNTADSVALEALPQLGPATAHGIVQYRKKLGGYARKEQLYELYNQDSTRTAVFLPYLRIYPGEGLTLLDINALARQGRLYHPYIPKAQAKLIVAYVRQHGALARPSQLVELKLLDTASYRKVLPYLSF